MPSKVEEIEARRAARKAGSAQKKAEQYEKDLEALDALEIELGDGNVAKLELERFVPGLPTFAIVKAADKDYYKKFSQQVRRAGNNLEARGVAQESLGLCSIVYPPKGETLDAMLEAFPGLPVSAAIVATKLVEGNAEAEGKG